MNLEDLCGEHVLDAVDFDNEPIKDWADQYRDCGVLRFRLDGKVYAAIEDPDDGYRSMMDELITGDWPMKNTFPAIKVVGTHKTEGEYGGTNDILTLVVEQTGKVILEVGTEDVSDWYPLFVARFNPEAMEK